MRRLDALQLVRHRLKDTFAHARDPARGRVRGAERSAGDALRAALATNVIDTIGSDHSPAPPEIKHLDDGNLQKAWGGIASLGLTLPLLGVDALPAMTARPAALVGLAHRKGAIAPGRDADLVVFERTLEWTVTLEDLHFRHRISPYVGRKVKGRVETTYLRGRKIYDRGEFLGEPGGQLLERPPQ